MVELATAEGCIMRKKMMHKIKTHHGHGHGHNLKNRHHGRVNVCRGPAGHPSGLVGGEFFIVFRGRHHHHHHHNLTPRGEERGRPDHHHHGKKHHRKGHGHGHGPFGHDLGLEAGLKHHRIGHGHGPFGHGLGPQAGLKHHGRSLHHRRCVKLGLIFQHEGGEGSGTGGHEEQNDTQAAPGTPTVPQAEAMMENLTLATTDKETNNQP